jgi:monoamine oxidase
MKKKTRIDVVVIGAGAAGLIAAVELEAAGFSVLVLEARDYVGGRIQTLNSPDFSFRVEAGAEFIHGELELSHVLANSAGAEQRATNGKFYECVSSSVKESGFEAAGWDDLIAALGKVKKDIPIKEFMDQRFPLSRYPELYPMVMRFVQGYDAADPAKISSLALRDEWKKSADEEEYRFTDGYQKIIAWLAGKLNGIVLLDKVVAKIVWEKGHVTVSTEDNESYEASCALVTVPISILQKEKITFSPPLPGHLEASTKIGFGSVIKFIFEFDVGFWQQHVLRRYNEFAFIFSDAPIPTWWSQLPEKFPIITGWLGGPNAENLPGNARQFRTAVKSLSQILGCPEADVERNIRAWHIADWSSDPFSLGAYSYPMVGTADAIKLFLSGVENTLFFGGEAYYDGEAMGTVEAALISGKQVAQKMIAILPDYQL